MLTRPRLLLYTTAALLLLAMLGTNQLWTMEGRWAEICRQMVRTGDYLHPRLFQDDYYDKPVLSYWLMIVCSWFTGGLNEWSLRLPSAAAGLLAIFCVQRLGERLWNRDAGLAAGWVLLSCGMFVFWARIASADILNLAGILAAVTWYAERRERPTFTTYAVFGLIVGATSLTKGLVAAALTVIIILPDVVTGWRRHVNPWLFLGALPGMALFAAPFVLGGGFDLVWRENFVRYFRAFDHTDPWWIYLRTLPVYLLPWTFVLPFVGWRIATRWKSLTPATRWMAWSSLGVLVFMSLSTSRRDYYILPIVPLLALLTADWLAEGGRRARVARGISMAACSIMLVYVAIAVPVSMTRGGMRIFRADVQAAAGASWESWDVVLLSAAPDAGWYLGDPGRAAYRISVDEPAKIGEFLRDHPRTILVVRRRRLESVAGFVEGCPRVMEKSRLPAMLERPSHEEELLVAFLVQKPAAKPTPQ